MNVLQVLEFFGATIISAGFVLDVADVYAREFVRGLQLNEWYGPSGIPLFFFGSRTIWRIQAQILGQLKDDDALAFKKSVYNECTMIAVAVRTTYEVDLSPTNEWQSAIVAQIAITGLSLNFLSQTHWVARAFFVLSLTFALMATYYATTQQRTLGRLLKAKEVRVWIRGGNRQSEAVRLVPSFDDIIMKLLRILSLDPTVSEEVHLRLRTFATPEVSVASFVSRVILRLQSDFQFSEPDEYIPELPDMGNFEKDIIRCCFTPSAASVITISAPQMLLSGSLLMLLLGLGIYLGFLWTRSLDETAGINDSRNVFITYVVGLAVSGFVYSISQLFQDAEKRSERQIVEGYLREYVDAHPDVVRSWGVDANPYGALSFTPILSGNSTAQAHETQAEQGSPADRQRAFVAPVSTRVRSSTDSIEMGVLNNPGGASG
jgi:hypothetical protein